jgi:ADP-ribose pyrophosphatase YjhB (NUDIX family)
MISDDQNVKTFVNVASAVIMKNENGTNSVLLIKRAKDDHWPNHWELPRGQCDKPHGEDVKHCVVREIKEASPCQDCGVKYPYYVMDFDHRENKKFIISTAYLRRGINIIFEEIKKCDLVCSNCHRQRTQNRIKLKK